MSRFKTDHKDLVTRRIHEVPGGAVTATVLSYRAAPSDPLPAYEVSVSDGTRSYHVVGVPGFEEAVRIADAAPGPTRETDGTVARFATRARAEGRRTVHQDFLRPLPADGATRAYPAAHAYYPLGDYGRGEPAGTGRDPDVRVVALDVTGEWPEGTVEVTGRIRAIFAYDANAVGEGGGRAVHFLRNVAENEGALEEACFGSDGGFSRSGDKYRDRLTDGEMEGCPTRDLELPDGFVDAYAFCGDGAVRASMVAELAKAARDGAGSASLVEAFPEDGPASAPPIP